MGLHTFGHFAAGYLGNMVGTKVLAHGLVLGGILNMYTDLASGSIDNFYGAAQSFVGGMLMLSSYAGLSFSESIKYNWSFAGKSDVETFTKYGL